MPRKLRIEYPEAMYRVRSRGNRRQDIFLDDVGRHDFLKTLAEACQKTAWKVHVFCLMTLYFALIALTLVGCVNVDPETGKTLPRGGQKYEFATVERRAEQLREGMTKLDVTLLLGSPAETSDDGDVWFYLPERPAVLVPTRGLRLVFKSNVLVTHDYTTIVLRQRL